jgi:hypothetical protein
MLNFNGDDKERMQQTWWVTSVEHLQKKAGRFSHQETTPLISMLMPSPSTQKIWRAAR